MPANLYPVPKRTKEKKIRGKAAEATSVVRQPVIESTNQLAVIETGGKQYLVKPGAELVVEKIAAEEKSSVDLKDLLHGKTVKAKVLEHFRTPKLLVIKFKPKVRYLRRHGHRQWQTRIRIEKIG